MNLHDYLIYNSETGDLIWKKRPAEHFVDERAWKTCNTNFAGKVAGAIGRMRNGRIIGKSVVIGKRRILAHRAIWEMMKGEIPIDRVIDHINGNTLDNRLENLRLATRSQNSINKKMVCTNTSGFRGVSWSNAAQKWVANIGVGGKQKHLGVFDTPEEAHEIYKAAAHELHGEFSRKSSFVKSA